MSDGSAENVFLCHHIVSLVELARNVSASWARIDDETRDYCMDVVEILKKRRDEIDQISTANETTNTQMGEMFCLPTMDHEPTNFAKINSTSQGPDERITRKIADKGIETFSPASWMRIDDETRDYCMDVVEILKKRRDEIYRRSTANETTNTQIGEMFCLPTMDHEPTKAVGLEFFR